MSKFKEGDVVRCVGGPDHGIPIETVLTVGPDDHVKYEGLAWMAEGGAHAFELATATEPVDYRARVLRFIEANYFDEDQVCQRLLRDLASEALDTVVDVVPAAVRFEQIGGYL